mmetsp:Transcript_44033/g.116461  ORF Transcript_44033/g.116461 Transcript_44033/m.116461 type:complete len:237 (-) Transcript_44033:640-1350(-)
MGTCGYNEVLLDVRIGKAKPTTRVRGQVDLGLLRDWLALWVLVALVPVKSNPDLSAAHHEICAPLHRLLCLLHASEANNSVATCLPFAVLHHLHKLDSTKSVHHFAQRSLIDIGWQPIDEHAVRLLGCVVTVGGALWSICTGALGSNPALGNKPLRCLQWTRGGISRPVAQSLRSHLAGRDELERVQPLPGLFLRSDGSEANEPADVPVLHCLKRGSGKEDGSGAGNVISRLHPHS